MDWGPPGSSIHRILQARILEWVAIPFSRKSSWPRDWIQVSRIAGRLFTIWATREDSKTIILNQSFICIACIDNTVHLLNHPHPCQESSVCLGGSDGKESACNEGDLGSISGLGRSPGEGNSNSLQYSYLDNPMSRGAKQAIVHGVEKSWTWLSNLAHAKTHI